MWVLLKTFNDYDQHGDYFIATFSVKPTLIEIQNIVGDRKLAHHILDKGGRIKDEDQWYTLKEVKHGEVYEDAPKY